MVKIQGNVEYQEPISAFNNSPFLQEHADYERKSADYALAIVGKFPDKTYAMGPLIQIALDALGIFAQLQQLMQARGILLMPEAPQNLYLKQLGWLGRTGREERFIDRIILGSIAENRVANRLETFATTLTDVELSLFYFKCIETKRACANNYMQLAKQTLTTSAVQERYDALLIEEEKIMASQHGAAGIF